MLDSQSFVSNYFLLTNIIVDCGFALMLLELLHNLLFLGGSGGLLCLFMCSSKRVLPMLSLTSLLALMYFNLAVTIDPMVVRALSHVSIRTFLSTTVSDRDAAEIFKNLLF